MMLPLDGPTLRFVHRFARPAPAPREQELLLEVDGEPRSATAYLPGALEPARATWILIHGVTVPGRHHMAVRRMARSLAAAGHAALVPEIPSWAALRVQPADAEPTIRSALRWIEAWPGANPERIGVMAFSVAATWALQVASGELRERLRAVVGLAGYGDFRRLVRAMVLGEHEWRGFGYRYRPDPYGRWIIGAGLLPLIGAGANEAHSEWSAAGRALHVLATTAGRNGALADEPVYDPLITRLRSQLPDSVRPAWDVLAPTSEAAPPDLQAGRALADVLSEAGVRAFPDLDPVGALAGIRAEVHLLHGRFDRLVPFTETLRLASQLPPQVRRSITITRLAGHTKTAEAAPLRNPLALARESWRFARFVRLSLRGVAG